VPKARRAGTLQSTDADDDLRRDPLEVRKATLEMVLAKAD
jgi:hypothetical protein